VNRDGGTVTVRRITKITFEAEETLAIRGRRHGLESACVLCGSHLGTVTPEEAAWLLRVQVAQVYREIESGRLHVLPGKTGTLNVCLGSVEKAAQLLFPGTKIQINHTEENS
jgi:hypothetical protein